MIVAKRRSAQRGARRRGLAAAALALVAASLSAAAAEAAGGPLSERLVTKATRQEVAITATFSGSELFVYGAIERNRPLGPDEPNPDVVVVVQGPSAPVMVRKKGRVGGLWMNTEAIRIAAAPSYYAVASTKPLEQILSDGEDRIHRVSLDNAVYILGLPTSAQDPEEFRLAAIRLRQNEGLYRSRPYGVELTEGLLYESQLRLPANIIEGDYLIRVLLIRDMKVVDAGEIEVLVRKQGIERFLFVAAQETPFLYGLGTLIVALLAGWGASELFRRLGRG